MTTQMKVSATPNNTCGFRMKSESESSIRANPTKAAHRFVVPWASCFGLLSKRTSGLFRQQSQQRKVRYAQITALGRKAPCWHHSVTLITVRASESTNVSHTLT